MRAVQRAYAGREEGYALDLWGATNRRPRALLEALDEFDRAYRTASSAERKRRRDRDRDRKKSENKG